MDGGGYMTRYLAPRMRAMLAIWALAAVLGLLLASADAPALAAKKGEKKKKTQETQEPGEPIDTNAASQPCYKLNHGKLFHRCEPQSLPYGRCRTGDMSCRGNYELSPIGWYKCADQNKKTTATPTAGSIFILGDNSDHRMGTGHVFVVEKVKELGSGHWELTLSHTNYDRRCSLETNVLAGYDQHKRLLTMRTGHWSKWGKNLKALGFIVK
jgi:hypothetical protein